jgi:hypothetical protein
VPKGTFFTTLRHRGHSRGLVRGASSLGGQWRRPATARAASPAAPAGWVARTGSNAGAAIDGGGGSLDEGRRFRPYVGGEALSRYCGLASGSGTMTGGV